MSDVETGGFDPAKVKDRIYAVGYRRLDRPERPRSPLWPIARTMLVLAWRQRATKFALLLCGAVALVCGFVLVGQLLFERFTVGGPGAGLLKPKAIVGTAQNTFSWFVSVQFYVTSFALAVVAGGCVADDRRAGAFDLYFARPLTPQHYMVGKLLGAGLVPTATILAPTLLLWLIAVGVAPPGGRENLWFLIVPAFGTALLASLVLTTSIVGLSALGERARTVGVVYVMGIALLTAICEGMAAAGQDWAGYLAPERNLRTVADSLLRVGPSALDSLIPKRASTTNDSAFTSALALGAMAFAGLGALWVRVTREVST